MYCSLDDLLGQVDKQKLIDLSNDNEEPVVDEDENPIINLENVQRAIDNAASEIDSYASVRNKVPFNPVPPIIRKLAVDIALYNLFSRKWTGDEEDNIIRRYKNAVKMLEKIAEGTIMLGVPEEKIHFHSPGKIFGDKFRQQYD
jgi:phage gp36-like protein